MAQRHPGLRHAEPAFALNASARKQRLAACLRPLSLYWRFRCPATATPQANPSRERAQTVPMTGEGVVLHVVEVIG
jgi:hypothetical protein